MILIRKQLGIIEESLMGIEKRIRRNGQDQRADEIKEVIEICHLEIDRQKAEEIKGYMQA